MGDGRRPTLRDVAARAEVSFKTVSRVVNDEPGVSPALTDRVRQAVDELGFRPNVGARVLRRPDAPTGSIGVLLDDVADPFAATLLRAVQDAAVARRLVVLAASTDGDAGQERAQVAALAARVDGLILAPSGDDQSYLAAEIDSGTAVVCVARVPRRLPVDAVVATDAAGAASGVRHLAAHGHTRIAFVGEGDGGECLAGYRAGLVAAGLAPDASLVVAGLAEAAQAEDAVSALFRTAAPPTALFTARDAVTVAALRALHRMGRQRLVAVVGMGDFAAADLLSPAVTVVAQDPAGIGRRAAYLLFERLWGEPGPPTTHHVPTVLIPRGSGELPLR